MSYDKPKEYKKPETTISVEDNTGEATPREKVIRKPLPIIPHQRYKLKSNSEFV